MESYGQSIDSPLVRVIPYIPSSNVHEQMKGHAATSPGLQVPFEWLRRAAKDRKHVVTEVEASLDEVCNAYSAAKAPVKGPVYLPDIKFRRSCIMVQLRRASESQAGPSKRDAESTLDRACAQLQDLKRKVQTKMDYTLPWLQHNNQNGASSVLRKAVCNIWSCHICVPCTQHEIATQPRVTAAHGAGGLCEGRCALVTVQSGLYHFGSLPALQLVALGACEKADAHRTHARLKHLQQLGAPQQERMLAWQRQRLDIILVDHFLRSGLYDTAAELAKDSKVEVGPVLLNFGYQGEEGRTTFWNASGLRHGLH